MVKGTLVILRHGQTDYNAQKLMTGQRDIPLNKVGEAQADAAGALITTFVFDKAYSSTLGRAFMASTVLITYLVPPSILFIPLYAQIRNLGLSDSLTGLIAAYPSLDVDPGALMIGPSVG